MIEDLKKKYTWPDNEPMVTKSDQGWFSGNEFFLENLPKDVAVIVELGSWLGKSTKFFLKNYPQAIVIAVDHWKGSKEHQIRFKGILPTLYDKFLANCWIFKDRLIPLRASTLAGLEEIQRYAVAPNFIYVDAGHSFREVVDDITKSITLFPNAIIGGDDWLWGKEHPVQKAVKHCAREFKKGIKQSNNNWLYV